VNAEAPVLQMTAVRKGHGGIRPLRIQSLAILPGDRVAVTGPDVAAAEMIVNLVTGASLPDEGEVRVFGKNTRDVVSGDAWLASLDAFGIVTDRAVVLGEATLAQNLALPFTLAIDPIQPDVLDRVVRLADECDISREWLEQQTGALPPAVRARTHLARAIALGPSLLLMEHPTAALPESERGAFGSIVARVCDGRRLSMLAITLDGAFAAAAAHRVLALHPATGALARQKRGWLW
jgi:ABC-type iron transport system FetAB ATPase subunit